MLFINNRLKSTKHIKLYAILSIIFLGIICYGFWVTFIWDGVLKKQFGNYIFRSNYYSDSPFKFELENIGSTSEDKRFYLLVNSYSLEKNFIYFTYVNGGIGDNGWCYIRRKIYFGQINLNNNQIKDDISISIRPDLYYKLSKLDKKEMGWLQEKQNKCSVIYTLGL